MGPSPAALTQVVRQFQNQIFIGQELQNVNFLGFFKMKNPILTRIN